MDGSAGEQDVPVWKICRTSLALSFFIFVLPTVARAADSSMHWSGQRQVWEKGKDIVHLYGDAQLSQPGETLEAQEITIDRQARTAHAVGKCIYSTESIIIYGDEIDLDLENRTAVVKRGKASNGRYTLTGARLEKDSQGKFKAEDGEYTTCHDCPGSWSIYGERIELEVDDYVRMKGVVPRLAGAPIFWSPYFIFPMKSRRQSGFLFPQTGGASGHGFVFVLPYFWAINRSSDMTAGAGMYFRRGPRLEWEGRYALSEISKGIARFFYTRDSTDDAPAATNKNRWGLWVEQTQELPWNLLSRLRLNEASDSLYPIQFPADMAGTFEPVLTSDWSISRNASEGSGSVLLERHRNLFDFANPVSVDSKTVQLLPEVKWQSRDFSIIGSPSIFPLYGRLGLQARNFFRSDASFDDNLSVARGASEVGVFRPGVDPIREGFRFWAQPTLYSGFTPGGWLRLIPSVSYNWFAYSFGALAPAWTQGYPRFATEASFEVQKRWSSDLKQSLRPIFTYSWIPFLSQPDHPFLTQLKTSGFQFDSLDLVPLSNPPSLVSYFIPQGHSLTYGASTQWMRKVIDPSGIALSQPFAELRAAQTFNLAELNLPGPDQVPLTRLQVNSSLDISPILWTIDYKFYPYLQRIARLKQIQLVGDHSPHEFSTTASWILERGVHQEVLSFDRSVSLTYSFRRLDGTPVSNLTAAATYSINDYIMPGVSFSYDLLNNGHFMDRFVTQSVSLQLQNPTRCWRVGFGVRRTQASGVFYDFVLNLNITGDGFESIDQLAGRVGH